VAETTLYSSAKYSKVVGLHYFFPELWFSQDSKGIKIFNPVTGLMDYIFEFGKTTNYQLNLPANGGNLILANIVPEVKQSVNLFGIPDTLFPFRVIFGFDGGFKVSISRKFGFAYYEQYEFSTIYYELMGIKLGDSIYGTLTSLNEIEQNTEFSLLQNYPNPFRIKTRIRYSVPATFEGLTPHQSSSFNSAAGRKQPESLVTIRVYNVLGREIITLLNEEKPPGLYEIEFDPGTLSSNIYFCVFSVDQYEEIKKFILLR